MKTTRTRTRTVNLNTLTLQQLFVVARGAMILAGMMTILAATVAFVVLTCKFFLLCLQTVNAIAVEMTHLYTAQAVFVQFLLFVLFLCALTWFLAHCWRFVCRTVGLSIGLSNSAVSVHPSLARRTTNAQGPCFSYRTNRTSRTAHSSRAYPPVHSVRSVRFNPGYMHMAAAAAAGA